MSTKKVVEKSKTEIKLEERIDSLVNNLAESSKSNMDLQEKLEEVEDNLNGVLHSNKQLNEVLEDKNRLLDLSDTVIKELNNKIAQLNIAFHSSLQLNSSMQHDLVEIIGSFDPNKTIDIREYFRPDGSV